uniref:Uncharacterized protein n=1 Tax=Arundo donax TaxID=35708 RepID=A0A0A9GVT4_ARUDO
MTKERSWLSKKRVVYFEA